MFHRIRWASQVFLSGCYKVFYNTVAEFRSSLFCFIISRMSMGLALGTCQWSQYRHGQNRAIANRTYHKKTPILQQAFVKSPQYARLFATMCWGYKQGNKQSKNTAAAISKLQFAFFSLQKHGDQQGARMQYQRPTGLEYKWLVKVLHSRHLSRHGSAAEITAGGSRGRKGYLYVGEWPGVRLNSFYVVLHRFLEHPAHLSFSLED